MTFTTTHNLPFLSADDPISEEIKITGLQRYKIGTCGGQWGALMNDYFLLSVANSEPGNGHFDDVFEWFEYSCKRDNMNLVIMEIMNERLFVHLIQKRGFIPLGNKRRACVKVFNQDKYKQLKKYGNELIDRKGRSRF